MFSNYQISIISHVKKKCIFTCVQIPHFSDFSVVEILVKHCSLYNKRSYWPDLSLENARTYYTSVPLFFKFALKIKTWQVSRRGLKFCYKTENHKTTSLVQYVAQYSDVTIIRTLKTKTQFFSFQLSVNEVVQMKAEHLSFKMKVLASWKLAKQSQKTPFWWGE